MSTLGTCGLGYCGVPHACEPSPPCRDERRALLEQVSSGIIPEPEAALIRSVLSGMSKGVQTLAWDADAGLPKGAGALIRLQALCALDHVYYRDTGVSENIAHA